MLYGMLRRGGDEGEPPEMAPARGFTRQLGLIVVAAAVPMAEAAAVNAITPSARVLAPQVTALAPLAVFHDLRWLFGFGGTWPRFALALLGLAPRAGPAAARDPARLRRHPHPQRGPADVAAGHADLRGGPAAVLLAVPRRA